MKIVYVDDQTQFHDDKIVERTAKLLSERIGIPVEYSFVTCGGDDDNTLMLDEKGRRVYSSDQNEYDAIPAQPIEDAAQDCDSLFLLDVKFPDSEFYGILLAKYLSNKHSVDTGRILLFTQYRDLVLEKERCAGGDVSWFKFYSKDEFLNKDTGWKRLASDLEGRVRAFSKSLPPSPRKGPDMGHVLLGQSSCWKKVEEKINKAAQTDTRVLILGESGTGKELVAQKIHNLSARGYADLIPVYCGEPNQNLIESELFGHEKGAFTGAMQHRIGLLESANDGTILFDEIADVPIPVQLKLFRVLQEKKFKRVGGNDWRPLKARVMAATNKDLQKEIKEGRFREELYYRLKVFTIHLPPLREREGDILLLAAHFLKKFSAIKREQVLGFTPTSLAHLQIYSWPGNIRELENAIEGAVANCSGSQIEVGDLPEFPTDRCNIHPKMECAVASWTELYSQFDVLVPGKQDRRKFSKCLMQAAQERNAGNDGKADKWVLSLMLALAHELRILSTTLRGGELRFLCLIVGAVANFTTEGRAFLREECRLEEDNEIEAMIQKAERGTGHSLDGWWGNFKLAQSDIRMYLEDKITEVRKQLGSVSD